METGSEERRGRRPGGRVPFRVALVVINILLLAYTGVTIGLYSYRNAGQLVDGMVGGLFREHFSRVARAASDRLATATNALDLNRRRIAHGHIDRKNWDELGHHLVEMTQAFPTFGVVGWGDTDGNSLWSFRRADGVIVIDRYLVQLDGRTRFEELAPTGDGGWEVIEKDEDSDFDPRVRPWYLAAEDSPIPAWTEPYIFLPQEVPGVTHSMRVLDEKGELLGVTTVDFSLDFLSEVLLEFEHAGAGQVFIATPGGRLVAHTDPRFLVRTDAGGKKVIGDVFTTDDPILGGALSKHHIEGGRLMTTAPIAHAFSVDERRYLAMSESFEVAEGLEWHILLALEEAALIGPVLASRRATLGIGGIALLLAIGASYLFARRISGGIHILRDEMEKVGRFDIQPRDDWFSRITEIERLRGSIEVMKGGLRSFERFVPSELVRQLMREQEEATLGVERRELTLLFMDLAGFTTWSESVSPEALVETLGHYLGTASELVQAHDGTVDKFIGDAVMALWGAPLAVEDAPLKACRAAAAMEEAFGALADKGLGIRIGIHTGDALVGTLGSEQRFNYTAVGDAVNLAARLEGVNKFYGTTILVSGATWGSLGGAFFGRVVDRVAVKGRSQPVTLHELLGPVGKTTDDGRARVESYAAAFALYQDQDFARAFEALCAHLGTWPDDGPARVLRDRCRGLADTPPGEWDGVFVLTEK